MAKKTTKADFEDENDAAGQWLREHDAGLVAGDVTVVEDAAAPKKTTASKSSRKSAQTSKTKASKTAKDSGAVKKSEAKEAAKSSEEVKPAKKTTSRTAKNVSAQADAEKAAEQTAADDKPAAKAPRTAGIDPDHLSGA